MDVETHPLVRYGQRKGWDYRQTAEHFGIAYGTFRQMVRGFAGCSFQRAERISDLSGGKIRVVELLRWHERNRQSSAGGEAA